MSCGVYGYPLDEAARIARDTCMAAEFDDLDLTFYLFDRQAFDTWDAVFQLRA